MFDPWHGLYVHMYNSDMDLVHLWLLDYWSQTFGHLGYFHGWYMYNVFDDFCGFRWSRTLVYDELWQILLTSGLGALPETSLLSQRVANFGYSGHYPPFSPHPAPLFATFQISIREPLPCLYTMLHRCRTPPRRYQQWGRRGTAGYYRVTSGVSHTRLQSGSKFAPSSCQTPKCNETGISGYILFHGKQMVM